jgi:single-stranded DNA-specific DHH superfamily exonuclease
MTTLIYSHLDADGITSARVIALHIAGEIGKYVPTNVQVRFTPNVTFGVEGLNFDTLPPDINRIVLSDIGTSKEVLDGVSGWIEAGNAGARSAMLIDHHPPAPDWKEYQQPGFTILNDQEHCSASLAYHLFTMAADPDADREMLDWMAIWAIVGIYGDIAKDKKGARAILDKLASSHRELVSQLSGKYPKWIHQPAGMVARALNIPRRHFFDLGASIGYHALAEAEQANDPFQMVRTVPIEDWVRFPYTVMLRKLIEEVRVKENEFVEHRLLDYDAIGISIITSKADVAGNFARKDKKDLGKPVICINDGILPGHYKLSGRSDSLDLSKVMEVAGAISGGLIKGGGHPMAVAGHFPKIPLKQACFFLAEAARMVAGEQGAVPGRTRMLRATEETEDTFGL